MYMWRLIWERYFLFNISKKIVFCFLGFIKCVQKKIVYNILYVKIEIGEIEESFSYLRSKILRWMKKEQEESIINIRGYNYCDKM